MRSLSGITVQVDERWTGSQNRPRKNTKTPARRSRLRWPGALRSARLRRLILILALLLAAILAAWLFPARQVMGQMLGWSAQAGFRVDDIFVEGRVKTPRDQLLAAMNVTRGQAIFAVDLGALRQRVEQIPWVRSAAVERRLPDQIHILITERLPIALWQSKGRYFLIDKDGQIVGDQIDDYPDLPLTVGEGAPDHAAQLLTLLQSEPTLQGRVKAATWIGDRRWNITIDRTSDGIEVRLPEENAAEAWHDLARLEAEQSLLERQVSVIDLRLPDRMVLRASGAGHDPATIARHKSPNGKDA